MRIFKTKYNIDIRIGMFRVVLSIILSLCSLAAWSIDKQLDSVLYVLDKTIKERPTFELQKVSKINSLKQQIASTKDNKQIYSLYGQLFGEYKGFQMDSALSVSNNRLLVARKLGDPKDISTAEMNISEIMGMTGMYKEALDILAEQDRRLFDKEQLAYSFHLYHAIYTLMADYSISQKERREYETLTYQYKDSILSLLPPDGTDYALVKSTQLLMAGEYDKALSVANDIYRKISDNTHTTAIVTYILSDIYNKKGNKEEEKKYLAISAINDLKSGVKEYISLRKLAILLYEEGDIDRAYLYMKYSMEDAISSNARLRTLELARMLPLINTTYDMKMKAERNRLLILLVVISVLTIVLVGTIIYVYKQLKRLARARRSLKEINADLKEMNNNLNSLNIDLSESNMVKEEYISYVFSMCSSYIDKLEDMRKKVNRKIKAGQIDELFKMTNSASFVNDELKDFYRSFDTIFLHLYPDFVDEFNQLLHPNEQIRPKEGELLSPELRIYALVRLGINDSVKIAGFLHYSPQTVYNYRLKVRNKSISKDDFAGAINNIGRFKKHIEA